MAQCWAHNQFSLSRQIIEAAANQEAQSPPAWLGKETFVPFPFLFSLFRQVGEYSEGVDVSTPAIISPGSLEP